MDIRVIVATRTDFSLTLLFDVHFGNIASQCETFHFFNGPSVRSFTYFHCFYLGADRFRCGPAIDKYTIAPIFYQIVLQFYRTDTHFIGLSPMHFALTDIAENIVQNKTMSSELTSPF